MTLEFLPEAQAEFYEAVEYYEAKEEGLGDRFRSEVWEVCSAILEHPYLWHERAAGVRRVNCPVFPYYIAYFIRRETLVIAAVAHGRRHPNYWKKRLGGE